MIKKEQGLPLIIENATALKYASRKAIVGLTRFTEMKKKHVFFYGLFAVASLVSGCNLSLSNGKGDTEIPYEFPEAAQGNPPAETAVGPRNPLVERTGGSLTAGTYANYRFTSRVTLQSKTGAYTFTDCRFDAGLDTVDGRSVSGRPVLVDHCYFNGGVYFEFGGQKDWTMRWTQIVGDRKAFRPAGLTGQQDTTSPTPCTVEDCVFSITQKGTPEDHVDTMQALGGNRMTFTRVRFTTPGLYVDGTTGQTSAVNTNAGDTLFDACEFLEAEAFYYSVYSNAKNVLFRNCRIIKGLAGYVYPSNPNKATFTGCTDYASGIGIH